MLNRTNRDCVNLMPVGSILTGFFSSVPERIGAAALADRREFKGDVGMLAPTSAVLPVDRPACDYTKSGNELPVEISNAEKNAVGANSVKRNVEFIDAGKLSVSHKAVFSAYKPHRTHERAEGYFPA